MVGKKWVFLLMILLANQVFARDQHARFKKPSMVDGAGCEAGSVTTVGEGTETLSLLFGRYDAGKNSLSGRMRTHCSFSVPVEVPEGYRLSSLSADWMGFIQGKGKLRRHYSILRSGNRPWKVNHYNSPQGLNYLEHDDMEAKRFGDHCQGGQYNIQVNSEIMTAGQDSYIAVDTLDLQNRVTFRLGWSACGAAVSSHATRDNSRSRHSRH